jgi:BASS family bile acid:Na+ symporter
MIDKLVRYCTKYMAFGVIVAGFFGILVPSAMKPYAKYIPTLLGIIMFGMGLSLKPEDFRNVFRQPKNVAIGTLLQFIIMPALAYLLVKILGLPPEIAIGVVLVGCCPGGTASNVISYIAHADVALSVSMTMVNTMLAPFVTPLLIWLIAGAWIKISLVSMMISIIKMVLLPLLLGLVCNHFFPRQVEKATKYMPLFSSLVIMLTVLCVVSLSGRTILDNGLVILLAVILHNLGGMALGNLAARRLGMNKAQVRAMTIEVGMQNSGLASTLALMYFTAAGGIAGAIFSVWHNVTGSLYASWCVGHDEDEEAASCVPGDASVRTK